MEKENPVIKNYIYSSEKRLIGESIPPIYPENLKCHTLSMQNKDYVFLFLL